MTFIEQFLFETFGQWPPWLIYLLLWASALTENIFPPFPGDTITVFGAYLAGIGILEPIPVMLWTACGNMVSNLLIYYLGRYRGRALIRRHPHLFSGRLLARAALFYRRWGIRALFFSRFMVGLRSIVPLFAGISRFRLRRFLLPVSLSILVQHSLLVWLGYSLGQNWSRIARVLRDVNLGLALVALTLLVLIGVWYWRVRHSDRHRSFGRGHKNIKGRDKDNA